MSRPLAGGALLVVAAGHLGLGAARYRDVFAHLLRDGWVDSVQGPRVEASQVLRRQQAFWFETTGLGLLLLGAQTAQLERQGLRPPRQTGLALAALALAGGAAIPVSGFWALLLPAGLLARVPLHPDSGRRRARLLRTVTTSHPTARRWQTCAEGPRRRRAVPGSRSDDAGGVVGRPGEQRVGHGLEPGQSASGADTSP